MTEVDEPDDLWALDPDEFVAARNALVRSLKSAGDRDRAAEVASWRRPPRSAWALNLSASSEPEHLNAMREAGSRLSESFGAGGDDIRTLQVGYRDSVEAATAAAMRLSGLDGETHRSRIARHAAAASADPEVDEQLRTGTVTDDHDPPGFAAAPGASVGRSRPSATATAGRSKPRSTASLSVVTSPEAKPTAAERRRLEREDRRHGDETVRSSGGSGPKPNGSDVRAEKLGDAADVAEERAVDARRLADDAAAEAGAAETELDRPDRTRPPDRLARTRPDRTSTNL